MCLMVLNEINAFIELANKVAELRKLASPEYKESAKGFYCICKMILKANENSARWFNLLRRVGLFGLAPQQFHYKHLRS
jgi:hypothetical protein